MIELEPEIMKLAEGAETFAELKAILQEKEVDISEPDLRELAWMLEITHGYDCPCCMGMFNALRMRNQSLQKRIQF